MSEQRVRLAIQKSGRLSEDSATLLKRCGISFNNGLGKLRSQAGNFPLELFFLRDDDIPEYVADGVADIGIVGENIMMESLRNTSVIEKLGFGRCRLSIAVPKTMEYADSSSLRGRKIATSYPRILTAFLRENSIECEVHTISGSVEIAPSIGLADAVCDLVSSGSTLFTNGLREVETVLESEAVLISRPDMPPEVQTILDRLLFRIRAVKAAKENKYILLNAPNEKLDTIISILPGIKSPTIMPLAKDGWSSIHSVINENEFWTVVETLKKEGAEGILVLSIDQMIQ
jgi:ATP phosphoribosyltransferase